MICYPILCLKYHPLFYGIEQRHILEAESFPLKVSEKEKGKKNRELEDKVRQLEQQHKINSTSSLLNSLKEARSLINKKIEGNLRFTNQKYYENDKRASRLLALRLKKQQSSNIVQKLQEKIISTLKYNKSPDPDGYINEFYNAYRNYITFITTCLPSCIKIWNHGPLDSQLR